MSKPFPDKWILFSNCFLNMPSPLFPPTPFFFFFHSRQRNWSQDRHLCDEFWPRLGHRHGKCCWLVASRGMDGLSHQMLIMAKANLKSWYRCTTQEHCKGLFISCKHSFLQPDGVRRKEGAPCEEGRIPEPCLFWWQCPERTCSTKKWSLVLEPERRQNRKQKKSELIAVFWHVQGKLLMKRPEVWI